MDVVMCSWPLDDDDDEEHDDDLPQTQKPKHSYYLFWCFILLWESPMFPLKAQGEELLKARGYEQKYPPKPVEAKEMLMGLEGWIVVL